MTQTPGTEIILALFGGGSADQFNESTRRLSPTDYRELCCTLCCVRNEVAANCQERADEIDKFLARNGAGKPIGCKINALNSGRCPLVGSVPLALPKV